MAKKATVAVESSKSDWRAIGIAFAVLFVIGFLVDGMLLMPTWNDLQGIGLVRSENGGPVAMALWLFTILIAVWAMINLMRATGWDGMTTGFWVGAIYSLPLINQYGFFNIPFELSVIEVVKTLLSFSIAGYAVERWG